MALLEQIDQDLKEALKIGDTERLSVLRLIKTAITNQEKQEGKTVSDDQVLAAINREIKQRQDTIDQLGSTRPEMIESDKKAIEILLKYLPDQLNEEQIKKIVDQAITQINAAGLKDMGKVMSLVMSQTKGRADGGVVSKLVREKLQS